MALITEDGTGLANAESLANVAFADAYHAARGNASWGPLDATVKEQLLRKATDFIMYRFNGLWAYKQLTTSQALPFPRFVFGLPVGIQQATAELALIAQTTPLMPNIARGKKRVKIGPLEVEYDGASATATKFVAATMRIAPFLSQLVGGPFAKLVRT